MLGHRPDGARVLPTASVDAGEGPIWLRSPGCTGNEASLAECNGLWAPTSQCRHAEDVAIECQPRRLAPVVRATTPIPYESDVKVACGNVYVNAPTPAVPVRRLAAATTAPAGSVPWSASIRLQGTARSFHWCGAVVLSEFHVLTAAHCMEDYPRHVYRVRIGDWDAEVPDIGEQQFEVLAVHFHEEFNSGVYLNNDLAVIRLKPSLDGRGVRFGRRVVPVCLPPSSMAYEPGTMCTVAGWGSTGPGRGFARHMQSASLPLLATEQCASASVYGPNKLSSGMFCAGTLAGGADTCQGDSGGGLVCDSPNGDRGRVLVGLTSWGYGCGRPNRPGVYTNVIKYVHWIVEKMIEDDDSNK